jgi:hypothetical protein
VEPVGDRRTRLKVAIGVLAIGGILAGLWLAYGPRSAGDAEPTPAARTPALHDARATVSVWQAGAGRAERATIRCDGDSRSATGFWRSDPAKACDALASVRGALVGGPGCRRPLRSEVRLRAVGQFGTQRFDHRAQRAPCPNSEAWLAVNALAAPVLPPDQELEEPGQ